MNRKIHLLTALTFVSLLLLSSLSFGQTGLRDTLTNYTGTWFGSVTTVVNGETKMNSFQWRIHKVDNVREIIELTDLSKLVLDAEPITPVRSAHKGGTSSKGLWIELKDEHGAVVKVNLTAFRDEEGTLGLKTSEDAQKAGRDFYFLLKISDDTSTYVKSEKVVEVIVMPPPPPTNK